MSLRLSQPKVIFEKTQGYAYLNKTSPTSVLDSWAFNPMIQGETVNQKQCSFKIKRIDLKLRHCIIPLLLVCCQMLVPSKGWAQSSNNTNNFSSFYFTGTDNFVRNNPIFREWLPGDGLRVGPAEIHPSLGVAELYTDNVFRTNNRRRSDFVTTIAPGMQVYLPFGGKHSFLIDYRAAQLLYHKFSENNVLAQHGVGHLKLDFPGGLKVDLQGGHREGFVNRGSDVDTQQDDITTWNTNRFLSEASLLGQSMGVRLRLEFTELNFTNNNQGAPRDRDTMRARLTFFVPTSRIISGLLGFDVLNRSYDKNKQLDSFAHGVFTGFRLRTSKLLFGDFRIGYRILNFDRAPVVDPAKLMELSQMGLSRGGKQQKRLFMIGNIVWNPTSRFNIRVQPFRRIRQAAVFNTSTFVQTGISINARQKLTDRYALRGRFFYTNNKFEEGRRDNRFRWKGGIEYRAVTWLGFRFDYIFDRRSSNQNIFDYYSNTFMISVQGFL